MRQLRLNLKSQKPTVLPGDVGAPTILEATLEESNPYPSQDLQPLIITDADLPEDWLVPQTS